jgi:Ni2+-binding GTPase involved in maturation of urease and hydrogenase
VLDRLIRGYEEDGTSSTNNIAIKGDEKSGKTSLIIDIIKVVNKERNRCGRKVAKIKGESLNRRGLTATMPKLIGSDLIIERAGNLNPETVQDLVRTMNDYTEDMLVILEDNEAALERLFKVYPKLETLFSNVIEIKEIGVKDWVEVAKDYARARGYMVDEMGTLALHVKIGNAYSKKFELATDEIEEIIDEAIDKIKRKRKHSKKYRIDGFIVLREADFL